MDRDFGLNRRRRGDHYGVHLAVFDELAPISEREGDLRSYCGFSGAGGIGRGNCLNGTARIEPERRYLYGTAVVAADDTYSHHLDSSSIELDRSLSVLLPQVAAFRDDG